MPTGLDLVRMPGFDWPNNSKIDVAPLNAALQRYVQAGVQQAQADRDEERIGLQRDQLGLNRQRLDLDREQRQRQYNLDLWRTTQDVDLRTREQRLQEGQQQAVQWANRALLLRRIADPTERDSQISQFLSGTPGLMRLLSENGLVGADGSVASANHDRALDLLISRGRDPLAALQAEENLRATRTRTDDALYDRFLAMFGSGQIDQGAWERESQEGGIIRTLFPSGPPPFNQAPQVVQRIRARRSMRALSDEDFEGLNLAPEAITALRLQNALARAVGRSAPPGYRYVVRPDNSIGIERLPGADTDPRSPISLETLQTLMPTLDQAFSALAGTVRPDGSLDSSASIPMAERVAGSLGGWFGGRVSPRAAEAFDTVRHAVTQLSYALSGRQIANAEQTRLLDLFVPQAGDSPEISAFKINTVRRMLDRMIQTRGGASMTAGDRAQFISQLEINHRRLQRLIGEQADKGSKGSGGDGGGGPPKTDDWKIEPLP